MRYVPALLAAVLIAAPAYANFERGIEALKRGNAEAALPDLRAAAQAGDARAYVPLARAQLAAAKSVQDVRAARQWAEKAAATGSAEGQYLVYAATVSMPELNYVDREGKVDRKRYDALAARPISDREDEMTAYDMLGKSAQQGYPEATLALAGFLADNVGDGNRARAAAMLDKMPKRPPVFDDLRKRLAAIDGYGPTLAIVRMFDDAVAAGGKLAVAAAGEKDRKLKDCAAPKLLRIQRVGPIQKAVWLPLAVPELQRAYLMQGSWQEIWTYDVCGAETGVLLEFTADGLGGASAGAPRR
jgi:TPR repeat protein